MWGSWKSWVVVGQWLQQWWLKPQVKVRLSVGDWYFFTFFLCFSLNPSKWERFLWRVNVIYILAIRLCSHCLFSLWSGWNVYLLLNYFRPVIILKKEISFILLFLLIIAIVKTIWPILLCSKQHKISTQYIELLHFLLLLNLVL